MYITIISAYRTTLDEWQTKAAITVLLHEFEVTSQRELRADRGQCKMICTGIEWKPEKVTNFVLFWHIQPVELSHSVNSTILCSHSAFSGVRQIYVK